MKWTILTLIAFFPLALFAKDMGIPAHQETLIEESPNDIETGDNSIKEKIDPSEAEKTEDIGNTTEQKVSDAEATDEQVADADSLSESGEAEEFCRLAGIKHLIFEADVLAIDEIVNDEPDGTSKRSSPPT